MIRQLLTVSILGAALISAAPAFAQDAKTMTVSYADLNLASSAGAAAFQRRIDHAVAALCGEPTTGDLSDYAAMGRCRAQARADVQPQMQLAYAKAGASGAIVLASR